MWPLTPGQGVTAQQVENDPSALCGRCGPVGLLGDLQHSAGISVSASKSEAAGVQVSGVPVHEWWWDGAVRRQQVHRALHGSDPLRPAHELRVGCNALASVQIPALLLISVAKSHEQREKTTWRETDKGNKTLSVFITENV